MSELHSLSALRQAADHLRAEERHWWADTIMAVIETLTRDDSAAGAIERVRELHRPMDVDVLQSDCAAEDCEHEDECPTIERTVCKACYILGESIDIYCYERGGIEYVYYPCPTIQALDGVGPMSDLRELLGQHTGVRIFNGSVYCHPCGELLYDPLEGFCGGPLIQRGGETIGEAAHASHLNVFLPDLLAQAWDQGLRAEQRRQEPCLLHDTTGEDVPGWEMAECTCKDLTNPYREEARDA